MTVAPAVTEMKPCPSCGREIADAGTVCESCEAWAAALAAPGPASETSQAPETVAVPATRSRRQLTLIAAAVAAVGLTGFAMSARGGSAGAPSATADANPSAHAVPAPPSAPPAAAETSVETWSTAHAASWLDRGVRGAAFDLRAENIVRTSLGPARPTLVVRCTAQRIEAFVVAGSPMKIDPRVDGKAVTIGMDGEPMRTEHWTDADDRTAVFAPDAAAFAERLRAARTLRFGYTPHNSDDVVAQFNVAGLDGLMAAASKHCGATK